MNFAHYGAGLPFDALAQNLVNSYDSVRSPPEYLETPADLKAFLVAHGFRAREISQANLVAVRALRKCARRVFEAASVGQKVQAVNALLKSVRPQLQLEGAEENLHIAWHVDPSGSLIDQLSSAVALNLAFLIEHFGAERFRVCVTEPCRDVFMDLSKGGTRRYCGMSCANRARVASFRERQRAGES